MMNKILIVGHPNSGLHKVEDLLLHSGMSAPLETQNEGLLPQEITSLICESYGVINGGEGSNESKEIYQLDVSDVWHGLILGSILANTGEKIWGWADSSLIYLLDFWKNRDNQAFFVLVYDAPETLLVGMGGDVDGCIIDEKLKVWQDYNAELLEFYGRNTDRCVLVSSSAAVSSVNKSLREINKKVDFRLGQSGLDSDYSDVLIPENNELPQLVSNEFDEHNLAIYLATQLINKYPDVLALFDLLQEKSNLPDFRESENSQNYELMAFKEYLNKSYLLSQQSEMLLNKDNENSQLVTSLINQELENTRLTDQLIETSKKAREEAIEKNMLILQLDQLQEDLELHYLDSVKSHDDVEELKQQLLNLEEKKAFFQGKAEWRANKVEELKATVTNYKDKLSKLENSGAQVGNDNALIHQINELQESLEVYYLENEYLKTQLGAKSGRSPSKYGAAQVVQASAPYLIGNMVVDGMKNFSNAKQLPVNLYKQYQIMKKLDDSRLFPDVAEYSDGDEADRIKKHLSYRVGATLIAEMRTVKGLVKLPVLLAKDVLAFKVEQRMRKKKVK